MNIYTDAPAGNDEFHLVRSPADLQQAGDGHEVLLVGEVEDGQDARWSAALGRAAMRGANVRRMA